MTDTAPRTRFPSASEIEAPPGAEGWRQLYPYFLLFHESRREVDEAKFWFCDSQHWPQVFKPFDATLMEYAVQTLGQFNTRHYLIPPANGVEFRIHNGYCYMSPVAVPPEQIGDRVPHFMERAGHYFANWDELLNNWDTKVRGVIRELEALTFAPLPEMVPLEDVTGGKGLAPTHGLIETYEKAISLAFRQWQYHFEFLNLGYAAYLDFFGFCKEAFPDIPDQAIAKMVQGVDFELFRPDDELKGLAKLAVQLELQPELRGDAEVVFARLAESHSGRAWLDAWDKAKDPWFNYSAGNGFYSTDKVWADHPDVPLSFIRDYVAMLGEGRTIDRDIEHVVAERDRITGEYGALLDDETRAHFGAKLGLARTVYPYVENHNFYIEHWSMSVFWRKLRELSQVFVDAGFWADVGDMFYLRRDEIEVAIADYSNGWAVGVPATGPDYWPEEIARRKAIVEALSSARPQPALGRPPEVITEPFTIMLWGITSERLEGWLGGAQGSGRITGMAASPGQVEGRARVILDASGLSEFQDGEILVTQVTAPSWAPVFARLRATVTDIGGMMSHAAIVCREYGLPAVTGTGNATAVIRTGQRLRVDGNTGQVSILADEGETEGSAAD